MDRIHLDWFWMGLGLIRIEKFLRNRSEWNCLVRIQILEWFGKFWIGSEWISIRNFHQDNTLLDLFIKENNYFNQLMLIRSRNTGNNRNLSFAIWSDSFFFNINFVNTVELQISYLKLHFSRNGLIKNDKV